MIAAARTTAVAVALGAGGWLLFLAVAAAMSAGAAPADPAALYPADWSFAGAVLARSLLLCGAVWLVAWILARRGEPVGRAACAAAAVLLVAAWASRSGVAAADLGVGVDWWRLAAATGPHAAAELGLIALPLVAAARGHAPRAGWVAAAATGLAACAVLEAFV